MYTITITEDQPDGYVTDFQRVGEKLNEETNEKEPKYEYVENKFKTRTKTVTIYSQQLPTIDIAEIILAVNQPHIIARASSKPAA